MLKNIGLIGDSIAHGFCDSQDLGWFARMGKIILSKKTNPYLFSNLAYMGDNIADTANRAHAEILSRKFDLIIISIGINDLRRRKNSNSELDFSEGLRIMYWNKLLDIIKQTNAKAVVTDLLPIIENRYMPEANLTRLNSDVIRYNAIIEDICKQRNISFFARYERWQHYNLENIYEDAIHPNSQGHQIIAQEMFTFLEQNNLL
ncbi:MAG: SGNH/GDSL hydrolase family protein [Alphaproteobacteria bacterium]|nr:SGNH/GDSL hydrolase family protein [Alphaproteobacteria bacterium]